VARFLEGMRKAGWARCDEDFTNIAGWSVRADVAGIGRSAGFFDRPIKLIVRFPADGSQTYFSHNLSGTASRSGQAIIPL
jgi:hypothetical protein